MIAGNNNMDNAKNRKSLRSMIAAALAGLTVALLAASSAPAHADLTGPGSPPPPPANGVRH